MAEFYLQFYKAPRVFRITNKQGYPEHVEFFIQETGGQRTAMVTPLNGQMRVPPQMMPIKGMPDVKVLTGSALPYARAQKTATALQLFDRKAIDQEELLKALDWPNAQEVIQRMAQQMAMQPPEPQ